MPDMNDWNRQLIEEFRANGGKVGGMWEGRRCFCSRPPAQRADSTAEPGDVPARWRPPAVFASKGGAPTNPDWYHNLLAHPEVTIEVGNETYDATATPLTGEERDRPMLSGRASHNSASIRRRPRVRFPRLHWNNTKGRSLAHERT